MKILSIDVGIKKLTFCPLYQRHCWHQEYTIGPTQTWLEHLEQNKIIELGRTDYCFGRGMSWGKYSM